MQKNKHRAKFHLFGYLFHLRFLNMLKNAGTHAPIQNSGNPRSFSELSPPSKPSDGIANSLASEQRKSGRISSLTEKIADRSAKVAVLGMGYVGLSIALETANSGFSTLGIDISEEKVKCLNEGGSYNSDIHALEIKNLVQSGKLKASCTKDGLSEADVIFICVPIPLDSKDQPVLTFLLQAVESIQKHLRRGQLVILESTTFPGTTEEVILPLLRESGLEVEKDFCLAYSPERIDPGNREYKLKNTPKLIGGITPACSRMAQSFYQCFIEQTIIVSSPRVAEMAKLHENTFRAVNIAFANEMAINCDRLGIDIWEVIEAASSKPFGFMPFYPGPGIGGHCIPVVPHYIRWKLKSLNRNERFIQVADEVNDAMPHFVVEKIGEALAREGKGIAKSKILILGVAFKADVNDSSNSPALPILEILQANGAKIAYHDPFVPRFSIPGRELDSIPLDRLGEFDCCVLITHHRCFDMLDIVRHSKLLVDTRNATRGIQGYDQRIVKI